MSSRAMPRRRYPGSVAIFRICTWPSTTQPPQYPTSRLPSYAAHQVRSLRGSSSATSVAAQASLPMVSPSRRATSRTWATSSGRYASAAAAPDASSCTPVRRFFGSVLARRIRSFSSASDRRVYTGSSVAGLPSPIRGASIKPRPETDHNASGASSPSSVKISAYFVRASPRMMSCRVIVPASASQSSEASASSSHSPAATAFTTVSLVSRRTPDSSRSNKAGYTSLRMASAATSTRPRTPSAHAFHATASSVDTPRSGTSRADAAPLAVAMQIRTPVKLPGPRPHTIAAMSPLEIPAASSAASTSDRSTVLLARWAATSCVFTMSTDADFNASTLREATASLSRSFPTPMATTSLAVSNARIYSRACSPMNMPFPALCAHNLSDCTDFPRKAHAFGRKPESRHENGRLSPSGLPEQQSSWFAISTLTESCFTR